MTEQRSTPISQQMIIPGLGWVNPHEEIVRLNRELLQARLNHQRDVETIGRIFNEKACEHELCDSYEDAINVVNPLLVGPTKLQHRSCDCC